MRIEPLSLTGLLLITPEPFEDARGYFMETVDGIFHKPFSAVKLVQRAVQAAKE